MQTKDSLFGKIIRALAMGALKTGMDSRCTVVGIEQAVPRATQIGRHCTGLIVSEAVTYMRFLTNEV